MGALHDVRAHTGGHLESNHDPRLLSTAGLVGENAARNQQRPHVALLPAAGQHVAPAKGHHVTNSM